MIIFLALLLGLTQTTFAQDESITDSNILRSLNVMGDQMSFTYSVGGGCERHLPVVGAKVVGIKNEGHPILETPQVQIFIQDKTETGHPDNCKSIIEVSSQVWLTYHVTAALEEANRKNTSTVELILPSLLKAINTETRIME
ncbi:MAG: hypothetical protein AB7F43_01540 [Bacteriovoracia bacterium]